VGSRKWNREQGIKRTAPRRPSARLGTDHVLPRLRVLPDREGHFIEVLAPRPHVSGGGEGWWQAVMNDWRQARQSHHHFDVLGEHSGSTLVIRCAQCHLRREFAVSDLLALYRVDYRMVFLRYEIAECPAGKTIDECGVRYAND